MTPLHERISGTADNLAALIETCDPNEYEVYLEVDDIRMHIDRLREAAAALKPPPVPTSDAPIEARLLHAASALGVLLSEAHVLPTKGATPGAGLLSDIWALLGEAATAILGKQAVLRGLMDTYTAAGGAGVASLESIEAAIKRGADQTQAFRHRYGPLVQAFEEASGGRSPTMDDLKAAIHRGAR